MNAHTTAGRDHAQAEAVGSRQSPPLGRTPRLLPNPPDGPEVQLPPPMPCIEMTDGTPAACFQKNAAAFLDGDVPGVMAQYGAQLFGTQQHTHSAQPAPQQDAEGVETLVTLREENQT